MACAMTLVFEDIDLTELRSVHDVTRQSFRNLLARRVSPASEQPAPVHPLSPPQAGAGLIPIPRSCE